MYDLYELSLSFACVRYLYTRILLALQNGLIEDREAYELIEEILSKIPDYSIEKVFLSDKDTITISIKREVLLAILTVSSFEDIDMNRNLVGAELILQAKNVLTNKSEGKYESEEEEIRRIKRLLEGGELWCEGKR